MSNWTPDSWRFSEANKVNISPSVDAWCKLLKTAIYGRQGVHIGLLLNPTKANQFFTSAALQQLKAEEIDAVSHSMGKSIPFASDSFTQTISSYLNILKVLNPPTDGVVAWSSIVKLGVKFFNQWIDIYKSAEARPYTWLVPSLAAICSFLTQAGYEADQREANSIPSPEIANITETTDKSDSAEMSDMLLQNDSQQLVLNTVRQHIGKFRSDKHRQAAYIILMSESIRGCLMLRNMQMASSFLKTIESSPLSSVNNLPRGPTVNFRYLLGKLYMQQEVFNKAEIALAWAFSNCRPNNTNMRRNILECLVAVRLRMGIAPPLELLQKYSLLPYGELITAIKRGSILQFDEAMRTYEAQFLSEGTWLCLERVKSRVYCQLVKRTRNWWLSSRPNAQSSNIIPIGIFTAAFKWQCDDDLLEFNDAEMACIIANLIKDGHIKGYIAWEYMKVVFSRQNPFPKMR